MSNYNHVCKSTDIIFMSYLPELRKIKPRKSDLFCDFYCYVQLECMYGFLCSVYVSTVECLSVPKNSLPF